MKEDRVVKWKVTLSLVFPLIISATLGFALAMLWVNPSLRSWFDPDYWSAMSRFEESLRLTHSKYVDENQSAFDQLAERAIEGMVDGLDRHSSYYSPVQYEAFQDDTHRRYLGIGVMIRKVERGVVLTKVFPGGPAEEAGLEVGECILEAQGESLKELELEGISSRIKGAKDSFVSLLVLGRDETRREVEVRRDEIEVSSVEGAKLDENGTGYLHLIQFTGRSAEEIRLALRGFGEKGMSRLVLDLRDNSGGLLSAAIEVADLFLPPDQLIVSVRGRDGVNLREFNSVTSKPFSVPLVILLNEGSASASEIVAGALSVLGRAQLVGEKSYGKGSVQTVFPLGHGAGLRLTTAMYFLPDGSTIHEQGIEPDLHVSCNESNETKLRLQWNVNQELNDKEFEELFGFRRIPDLQRIKALELLLGADLPQDR